MPMAHNSALQDSSCCSTCGSCATTLLAALLFRHGHTVLESRSLCPRTCSVALARVTWTRPHILLLDEPSNHLDIDAVEALIQARR
jgi:ATPase subunit of ABC transporter with duplicated ATPase domains